MDPQHRSDTLGNDLYDALTPQTRFMGIEDLPNEVMVQIFSKLELTQLSSLRLVCKNWNFIVSDNSVWEKSFKRKFGNNDIFPSFARTHNWIVEYLARLTNLKAWKKATAAHVTYQILNEVFVGDNLHNISSFAADRFLAYSGINNNVTLCNLHNGRNQTYIPGNVHSVASFAVNWNYLVYSTKEGGLFVRNLVTSTSSVSSRLSVKELLGPGENLGLITAISINKDTDKYKTRPDIITGSSSGSIRLWDMNGDIISSMNLEGSVLKIVSDFKHSIVVFCKTKIAFIDFKTLQVRVFLVAELDKDLVLDYECIMDVDTVGRNVIICFQNKLRVINYEEEFFLRRTDLDSAVKVGKMPRQNRRETIDRDVVGKDGLFYANVLHDDTIIVWNIRERTREIRPINRFTTQFKYKSLTTIVGADAQVNAIELNSTIIVVGGFNGFCNIHDVFTGKYLRECSTKYPKKYAQMHLIPIPVREIHLNESPTMTSGVTICGGLVQHFQFGERVDPKKDDQKRKVSLASGDKKHNSKKNIQDQLDDYDTEEYKKEQLYHMLDKYNGDGYDSEEEVSIALAMSKSTQTPADGELQSALEASMQPHDEDLGIDDEDEALRLALELSLIEQ